MFWTSPVQGRRLALPGTPLVGSCIYVPGIRLDLPAGLPGIGVENLRPIDLPQPIVEISHAEGQSAPAWLPRRAGRGLKNWKAHGPVPPDVRLRFPEPKKRASK
jgi:hypothetical protein